MDTLPTNKNITSKPLRNPIRVGRESFEQSAELINKYAEQFHYEPWRVRVIDIQRASAHIDNADKVFSGHQEEGNLDISTLILNTNGYSFTTARNASIKNQNAKIISPYTLRVDKKEGLPLSQSPAQLFYEDQLINEIDTIKLYDVMSAASLWYFERKDSHGNPIHEKVFANPVTNCAFRCKPCSRLAFLKGSFDYKNNTDRMTAEISEQVLDRNEVKVVNISTGTLHSAEDDLELFRTIIESFRKRGFNKAKFSIQTSTIFDESQLRFLLGLGVDRFSVTMDGTSDEILSKLYCGKGPGNIDGYLEMVRRVEEIFPKVAVHIILGHDSVDTIKKTTERIAHFGNVAIHHYIPRIFHPHQFLSLHSETVDKGLLYYVELFRFIDDLNDARMAKWDLTNPFYGLQGS